MTTEASFSVKFNPINSGHFFACCGILELAHRIWSGAEGCFSDNLFKIFINSEAREPLSELLGKLQSAPLNSDDGGADPKTCPMRLGNPFDIRLDWWLDKETGGSELKTWAGQQSVISIAKAIKHSLSGCGDLQDLLNFQRIVKDPSENKTVDPFYFDPRRFVHGLDTGFSSDELKMEVPTFPAVEILTLIGLQRFRPKREERLRFRYVLWSEPLAASVAPAAMHELISLGDAYRFNLTPRDEQKRYKAFGFARKIGGLDNGR